MWGDRLSLRWFMDWHVRDLKCSHVASSSSQPILNTSAHGPNLSLHLNGGRFERVIVGIWIAVLLRIFKFPFRELPCILTFWVQAWQSSLLTLCACEGKRNTVYSCWSDKCSDTWLVAGYPIFTVYHNRHSVLKCLSWFPCLANAENSISVSVSMHVCIGFAESLGQLPNLIWAVPEGEGLRLPSLTL